ncbi:MAG: HAMP domain-containing histidine kinase [Anaerolineae bacterium]|nr:HAMP domain-containing histidine kinase [Anaerolineae bacterium]
MRKFLKAFSIRTRLLVLYAGIILIGFAAITVIAGGQIAGAARADYAQQLQNTITLIAQGVAPVMHGMEGQKIDDTALASTFAEYENQVNGKLTFYLLGDHDNGSSQGYPRESFRDSVELETALRGQVVAVERTGSDGNTYFYTAAPVIDKGEILGLLQLKVPTRNLLENIAQRWLGLGAIFALIALAAIMAAFWLARSIIQPLYKLRESANRLSQGNFAHRVTYDGKDEIGEVANAFNEMAHQVESMLEEQRAFASNTSHELRTPLTTIRLRTEALRYDNTLDQQVSRQYIEEIDDEVTRLGNLVQDLTLLSRFDAGRAELGQEQVDLSRLALSLQHQFARQADEKKIKLSLELPPTPVLIKGSLNHIMVLFRNLLDNAMKYSSAGRQIEWKIEATDSGVSSVIRDTGRGISKADLEHVFERFYRVDKSRSRETPGTGLGLALVKSIVDAYKGRISIDSAGIDQGTTVTVFLPH